MDALSSQLSQILSDPQSLARLSQMAGSLGLGGNSPPEPEPPPEASPPGGMGLSSALAPEMMGTVMKLAPLLGEINREDDSTRLLRALRPLLGEARQKKLDEALRLLQVIRLLPLLRESGLLPGKTAG